MNFNNEKQNFINPNYVKLKGNYLFSQIAKRVTEYSDANQDKEIIKLGIGDVTLPLPQAIIKAMHLAVDEMGSAKTFKGYGPEQGYEFLRNAILENDYCSRGVDLEIDEIFISDGAKCDCANITELFSQEAIVAVCDPVYPVYVDSNAMGGRAGDFNLTTSKWDKLIYMPCTEENDFLPQISDLKNNIKKPDLIYLCFPNNPTGVSINATELQKWVDYANENNAIILYDSAYEAYITEDLPHSIMEIPGSKTCAIEFRSFSKTAGFTGTRCAYTVVPSDLKREGISLNDMWSRRQATKFNGVSYVTQRAAQAVYSPEGKRQIASNINYYMENAKIIRNELTLAEFKVFGGINAPYIWLKNPKDQNSWDFFDYLLQTFQIVGTPGSGFGPCGEGYFRLTAFGSSENTIKAMKKIKGEKGE